MGPLKNRRAAESDRVVTSSKSLRRGRARKRSQEDRRQKTWHGDRPWGRWKETESTGNQQVKTGSPALGSRGVSGKGMDMILSAEGVGGDSEQMFSVGGLMYREGPCARSNGKEPVSKRPRFYFSDHLKIIEKKQANEALCSFM